MAMNFIRSSAMSSLRRPAPEPVPAASSIIPSPLPLADMTGISSSSKSSSSRYAMPPITPPAMIAGTGLRRQTSDLRRQTSHLGQSVLGLRSKVRSLTPSPLLPQPHFFRQPPHPLAVNRAVDSENRAEHEVPPSRQSWTHVRQRERHGANDCHDGVLLNLHARLQRLHGIQFEHAPQFVGVEVHQGKQREDRRKPSGVDAHEHLGFMQSEATRDVAASQLRKHESKNKFQRIHIEQDQEQQNDIQKHRIRIFQPKSSRKVVVR